MGAYQYSVIVVGARCAGFPTAMLLARQGYRVLLVDRATFPSDTISTHFIHPTGIAALNRWGLLDQLLSTGCPPVGTYAFDFGPFTIAGSPGTIRSACAAWQLRRCRLSRKVPCLVRDLPALWAYQQRCWLPRVDDESFG